MPDTIVQLCDPGQQNDCVDIGDKNDADVLALIAQNMATLGYTREMDPEINGADLFVFVSKVATKNVSGYSYPWWGYWGWYPGWGYPGYLPPGGGWNPYYPWCCTVTYTYTTGSLLANMMATESIDESPGEVSSVWGGGINWLLEGSDIQQSLLFNNIGYNNFCKFRCFFFY